MTPLHIALQCDGLMMKPNSSGILGKTTPLLDCDTWRVHACEELLDSSPDANMHMHMQIDDALLMNT